MAQRGNSGGPASSGQGKKRPTIEMVAERAGVSRQTVSNAANAPHRLRPETLQRVLGTIDELGYRPSHAGPFASDPGHRRHRLPPIAQQLRRYRRSAGPAHPCTM